MWPTLAPWRTVYSHPELNCFGKEPLILFLFRSQDNLIIFVRLLYDILPDDVTITTSTTNQHPANLSDVITDEIRTKSSILQQVLGTGSPDLEREVLFGGLFTETDPSSARTAFKLAQESTKHTSNRENRLQLDERQVKLWCQTERKTNQAFQTTLRAWKITIFLRAKIWR